MNNRIRINLYCRIQTGVLCITNYNYRELLYLVVAFESFSDQRIFYHFYIDRTRSHGHIASNFSSVKFVQCGRSFTL